MRAVYMITALVLMLLFCAAPGCDHRETPHPKSWMGIVPGTSTREDVLAILGEPLEKKSSDGWETYSYHSEVEVAFHRVVFKEGISQLIAVIISPDEEYPLEAAEKEFGEPEKVTYSYLMRGTKTYIFARQGVTLIVHEDLGLVLQKHFYVPMSLDAYMESWGKELPEEDPYIR